MQEHLLRAFTFLKGAATFLIKGIRELAVYAWGHKIVSGIVIAVLIGAGIGASIIFKAPDSASEITVREVTLLSAADLSAPEPLSLIGEMRAVSEASVAPEVSGTVSAVYAVLGQNVGAGTALAVLKNDSQRAAVDQAKAALAKAESGVTVSGIGLGSAQDSLNTAIESAKTQVSTAYATIDDSVHKKADEVFSNPNGNSPTFFVSNADSQAARNAENGRVAMQPILARESSSSVPNTADALVSELKTLLTEATKVRDFASSVVTALNTAIPTGAVTDSAIAGYRADASASLAQMNALRGAISGAIENLQAKQAAVSVSQENLGSSGTNPDILAAQANLAAAQANLEKTILRAPISGTINKLDIDVGSFVSASVPLVYITNAHGLEAVAFVSARDLPDIAQGADVSIGGNIHGKVTRVSSALDPATKKAEIRISVPESSGLVSGSSATLTIARTAPKNSNTLPSIPLSALKLTPEGSEVFTVENGILIAHPVTLGTLAGSRVTVTSGISSDMRLVEDARGLKEGQKVTVAGN